ncbi:unnamed protein product [Trypanosoma congolense IL3000]|uniref:WGS project CAEQ00000000 data, annotated contig 1693 n=1 Tax=Trypanosoma congolense (strain IL3000) TaxID=1068625 RepID=F9W823_TRYCI|nr:unnamed protein product [Trypanosoma congolense IL3000]
MKKSIMSVKAPKLFNKWSYDNLQTAEIALSDYITRTPTYVPHSAGRWQKKRFRKARIPIVERLTNGLMFKGRGNGKKLQAVRLVRHTLDIIHLLTDQNPIQVVIDAVSKGAPREDSTRVGAGGVVRRPSRRVSLMRRGNEAIYLMCKGAPRLLSQPENPSRMSCRRDRERVEGQLQFLRLQEEG